MCLLYRYMGQTEEALVLFNQLRKDPLLLVSTVCLFVCLFVCLLTFVHSISLHFQRGGCYIQYDRNLSESE